jgi:hypothetical protein
MPEYYKLYMKPEYIIFGSKVICGSRGAQTCAPYEREQFSFACCLSRNSEAVRLYALVITLHFKTSPQIFFVAECGREFA